MTSSAEIPHHGIELDRLDLSGISRNSPFQARTGPVQTPVDLKSFVNCLYKEMMKSSLFLSFSNQIRDVNEILKMKYASINDVAEVILKDVALTAKLIRLVNSSYYGSFTGKGVSSISEAMIILGTDEIKLAAASLKLYDLMKEAADIDILKEKTFKAFQQSIIARQIAVDEKIKDAEVIQVAAILYGFGEYLVVLFAPDTYVQIEITADEKQITREAASKSVLGISYNEIGRLIVSKWGLPKTITATMKPVSDFRRLKGQLNSEEIQRYVCSYASELSDIKIAAPGDTSRNRILKLTEKYRNALDIPAPRAVDLLKMSNEKIQHHAAILKTS